MLIHNARKHTIITAGIAFQKGWADGVVVTFEPMGEGYTRHKGTDGESVRGDTGEDDYTLTLQTQQGAAVNALFQALYNAGKAAGNGSDVGPFLLRNQLGTFEAASPECYIVSPAAWNLDRGPTARPWVFHVIKPLIIGA